ncbi:Rieske 2Fe-2S domain-containing protein [Rhodococcus sp. B10]|uniref:Rieske 2Fe-2S domain-containing protein n=1 Tax=Rhodococcus sp. B10 TaxID=2695876 RepID=UPI0014314288|nr:Rieske 2Fe-2S domain-containing protein [Rhodococcus sp. B10]NIL78951.1 Methylxanthine N1-demethylase NdmA [Rhodococcus sp. B10]
MTTQTGNEPVYDLNTSAATWRHFWHPVATLDELRAAKPGGRGPLQSKLLGEMIGIAEIGGKLIAFEDRCSHRGVALTLGWAEDDGLRCKYHGWCYGNDGSCKEVPSLTPDQPIPARARLKQYDCEERYGLVWVRLDSSVDTKIPDFLGWNDDTMHCIMGEPYQWPCSSGRRMENFMDVTHFPFTHWGTLGAPPNTVFPAYPVDQKNGTLTWKTDTYLAHNPGDDTYGPPADENAVMLPPAEYVIEVPFSIILKFTWSDSFATQIFMHATPIDEYTSRSYWFTCHTHDQSSDQIHLQLQDMVLGEDYPVVASHTPARIGDPRDEVSVFPDKPTIFWRRWIRELDAGAKRGPEALREALNQVSIESEDAQPVS